jgi:hypothetical protein
VRTILLTLLFLSAGARADLVEGITGASRPEREIRWLWKYIGEFTRSCAKSGAECKDPEIKAVVDQLTAGLPAAPGPTTSPWGQRLKFVSEKDNPNLFLSAANEAHRVAVTELKPGAPVYINSDRMAQLNHGQWIGVLVHETVHHLGIDDDARRLPDRVGAAVAAHVMSNWQESNMAEFGHPESTFLAFNDPALDRPARIMGQAFEFTMDEEAAPNPRLPICANGEKFKGQSMAAPLWRVVYLRGDKARAKIRGSARVTNVCVSASGAERTLLTNFTIMMDLVFQQPFDPKGAWWNLPSKLDAASLAAGNNDTQEELLEMYRTFVIQSSAPEKPVYHPGEEWRAKYVVESTDGFQPSACNAFFSASQWFFSRNVTTTMFEGFQSCALTPLGANRWQVDVKYTFAGAAVQPDAFALAFIHFPGPTGQPDRFAIPTRPVYVQLDNPSAPPRLKAVAWRVSGLQPRTTLFGGKIQNSYAVDYNQPFWLEFDFAGPQKPKRQFIDFDFIVENAGAQVLFPWNPPVEKITTVIPKVETVAIPGGFRLRYQMTLPPVVAQVKALGFKLRRLSVETDDFAWSELEIPNFLEGLFLTGALAP